MDSSNLLLRWYVRFFVVLGLVLCGYSVFHLPSLPGYRLFFFIVVTIVTSSSLTVKIPLVSGHISVSDTFIFLTVLLYGGEVATLLAFAEALCSSLLFNKKSIKISWPNILFNCSMMACATFTSAQLAYLTFGTLTDLLQKPLLSGQLLAALCFIALTQYVVNSGLAAGHTALRSRQPLLETWKNYYLWTSLTYFAGAWAAGLVGKLAFANGLTKQPLSNTITDELANSDSNFAVMAIIPVIVIIFFTYRTYLANIEALAAAAKAEQAERHVQELNRYISEQERIREQFTQMEKMSALGELASGVAHDFNNTLTGILGRAQLLLTSRDAQEIKRGLSLIVKTAEDGAKTVKRIQDFARQRRDHDFVPVALDQILLDVSEITRPRWKDHAEANNQHISLDMQLKSQAIILGDASELREVLVNMVFNAVDAMPDGGILTLSVEEEGEFAVIRVGDTGIGMVPEVASRVFDPFFTTKGTSGMGLGLAVSYGIVRRHEGLVEVKSEVGRGTTFHIKLPVAPPSARLILEKSGTGASVTPIKPFPSQRPRILVVEDEEFVSQLLKDILLVEGYEAVIARNGNEALERFDPKEFVAVFTDVGLPGLSGWEVARGIRMRDVAIPVAVITGWGEAVGSSEQKDAGVNWVVSKPFSLERIAEILRAVAEQNAQDATAA